MDYQKHYDAIVERGKLRKKSKLIYLEKHHILPKCMGGTNLKENLTYLTPEEHYVAHQLLAKIHPENISLIRAAVYMTTDRWGRRVNNKLFGWLKRDLSKMMSERIVSQETKDKISKSATGKTHPNGGWNEDSKILKSENMVGAGNNRFGTKHTAETKNKMSLKKAGEAHPAFGKLGIECPNYGRVHTAEQNLVTSKAMTGIKQRPATIAKRTATQARNRAAKMANK
jgi:hypothetical protein